MGEATDEALGGCCLAEHLAVLMFCAARCRAIYGIRCTRATMEVVTALGFNE